jgi:hypothetical protein
MGTYGVVTSVTLKTFPTVPVTGMGLNITDTGDRFWEGIRIWHTMAPVYTAAGMYVWYGMSEGSLIAQPFVAPNMTIPQFKAVVDPLLARLRAANISFTTTPVQTFPKFGDLYNTMWYNAFHGSGLSAYFGGRMISQRDIRERGDNITAAFRRMSNKYPGQVLFGGHLVNPGNRVKDPFQKLSAVHPVWRDTADIQIFLYLPPPCMSAEQRAEAERRVTRDLGDILREVTPHSAVYSNEVPRPLFECNAYAHEKLTNNTGRYQRAELAGCILGTGVPQVTPNQTEVRPRWRFLVQVQHRVREVGPPQ